MNEITHSLEFLGEENEEKIKTALTNAIIEELEESVQNGWVSPDLLAELLEECYVKVFKKHKKEMTDAIELRVLKLIEDVAIKETSDVINQD